MLDLGDLKTKLNAPPNYSSVHVELPLGICSCHVQIFLVTVAVTFVQQTR